MAKTAPCLVATAQSVLELSWLERTLLWATRVWAAYHDESQSVRQPLQRVFTDAGLAEAMRPFARLMECWFVGMHRLPDIRCVRCLRLGKDERALLQLLLEAAGTEPDSLLHALRRLMQPAAARMAIPAVMELRQILSAAGLLPARVADSVAASDADAWPPPYSLQASLY